MPEPQHDGMAEALKLSGAVARLQQWLSVDAQARACEISMDAEKVCVRLPTVEEVFEACESSLDSALCVALDKADGV